MKPRTENLMGIGLRSPHIAEVIAKRPAVGWLELHSENWFVDNEIIKQHLEELCSLYPISLHGVGLSLGSADGIDSRHLRQLNRLISETNPILVSEHISWGRIGQYHTNELLPLPYCKEALDILTRNVNSVQDSLGRQILLENLSHYGVLSDSNMPEWAFISQLVESTGCGLLLDLNNIYVTSHNIGTDLQSTYRDIPWWAVKEVHLAGYDEQQGVLIDTHARGVQEPVWSLYEQALPFLPATTRTLIEWDNDIPELNTLVKEAEKAHRIWQGVSDAVA
jgi:uncharacterized protein (UPF0276 family)